MILRDHTQDDVGVAVRKSAKTADERIFQCPFGLARIVSLTYVKPDAFAIAAIENRVHVDEPVQPRPHVRRIGRPANV